MSEFNIEVQGGSSVRLPTAGKYCDRDIIVTASGGGDNPMRYALMNNGFYLFNGAVFPEDYHLVFRIEGNTNSLTLNHYMSYTNAKKITFKTEKIPASLSLVSTFAGNGKTTEIVFENGKISPTTFSGTFNDCVKLEAIKGTLDLSKITSGNHTNAFGSCFALKEVRFEAESINLSLNFAGCFSLSAESIQSIIDGLAYVESSQNLTLSNQIVLTDNQKQVINAKGWTLIQ